MGKQTVSGTKEWAASSENVMTGCTHGCLYCYARAEALQRNQIAGPEAWADEKVRDKALRKGFGKRQGTVMFPTAHDITPSNVKHALVMLRKLLSAGNDVLIVSKPHEEVIRLLCENLAEYKSQILFRFTIGSADNKTLTLWEPSAPEFEERLRCLQIAYDEGFRTSVSMEPMLDTDEGEIVTLAELVYPFVTDSIWLGKANHLIRRLRANGFTEETHPAMFQAARDLLASQEDARIHALYARLKDNAKVKWKESIKKVVGLEIPTEAGMDV